MNKDEPQQPAFVEAISKNIQAINAVHVNVSQEYIMITEDKTFRCLTQWQSRVERKHAWLAPLTLCGSMLLTFVTATFRDALGMSKETWQAVFMLGIAASIVWMIVAVWRALTVRGEQTVEELIEQLKKGAVVQRTQIQADQSTTNKVLV
jgi:hypothetical protein